MRVSIFYLQAILLWSAASAQNMGFGTFRPMAKLHIVNNFEAFRLQGQTPYLSFYNNANEYTGYLWNRENISMDLGTPAGSNFPITLSPNYTPICAFLPDGSVGIGNTNPFYRLDLSGRMRIRHGTESAGVWFNNTFNSLQPAFVGMYNDAEVGLYGNYSWGLLSNTITGKNAIGAIPNASTLLLQSNTGPALQIAGGIKVSGTTPAAFRLTVGSSNLTDLEHGKYRSVLIDYPLSNNDANALLLITPVQFDMQVNLRVFYDASQSKWKITSNRRKNLVQTRSFGFGRNCNPLDPCYASLNDLILNEDWGFEPGNTFNVLIIKQ